MSAEVKKTIEELPDALIRISEIKNIIGDRKPVLFLDFDGTLSPIVANPDEAFLPEKTKAVIQKLAELIPVTVVSGRDRADVAHKVGMEALIYAGSHGFDITGPNALDMQHEGGLDAQDALDEASKNISEQLKDIKGAWVERKKYAIAVHYRNVAEDAIPIVKEVVLNELTQQRSKLKKGIGKKIIELKPDIDWHKGKAILWLMKTLNLNSGRYIPVFLGDDITDEDALGAIQGEGIGIIVGSHGENTAASYQLSDIEKVPEFLIQLYQLLK